MPTFCFAKKEAFNHATVSFPQTNGTTATVRTAADQWWGWEFQSEVLEFLPASPTGGIMEGITKQIPLVPALGTQGGPASMPTAHSLKVTVKYVWWPAQGISCVLTAFLLAPVITALVRFSPPSSALLYQSG